MNLTLGKYIAGKPQSTRVEITDEQINIYIRINVSDFNIDLNNV